MQVDSTTLADLELFADSNGGGGLLGLIDRTQTDGGHAALRRRLSVPECDPEAIRTTQRAVRFFAEHRGVLRLRNDGVGAVRRYLESNIIVDRPRSRLLAKLGALVYAIRFRDLYGELQRGVRATRGLLRDLAEQGRSLLSLDPPDVVRAEVERILEICERAQPRSPSEAPPTVLAHDRFLRGEGRTELDELIERVSELDALRAMGRSMASLGWALPEIADRGPFELAADGLVHPFLDAAVANPVEITAEAPLLFLTGPNMAGKTTYLRAVALLVLLAQVGMGVPAARARLRPVEALVTSLNPTDNLRAGLSLYYAEVLRVRDAAHLLAGGKRCFVLFDEVFRGTNVLDARDATARVVLGFAKANGSGFVFSSHLAELADALRAETRIRFRHFSGRVVGGRARYTYEVHEGVSDERLGLHLLEEAGVTELLDRMG